MKRSLSTLTEKELRNLISTLCSANSENALLVKLYLNDNSVLDSFEKKIEKALNPDRFSFREAKHYLSAIKKFCTDPQSVAELFVFAAETGNDITMEYGDIDENYYCSMENLFEASCKLVKNLPLNEDRDDLQERLHDLVEITSGIGWGYHDTLGDIYFESFPKSEAKGAEH